MKYHVVIEKKPLKFIMKQPRNQQERLLRAIYKLPDNGDIAAITDREGYFRLRVGDYRIIFTVDNGKYIVCVIDAGNRGQIYKKH